MFLLGGIGILLAGFSQVNTLLSRHDGWQGKGESQVQKANFVK